MDLNQLIVVCRLHYIEYLVGLIGRHKLDPVTILDLVEVSQEIRRRGRTLPDRPDSCSDQQYHSMCAKVCFLFLIVQWSVNVPNFLFAISRKLLCMLTFALTVCERFS